MVSEVLLCGLLRISACSALKDHFNAEHAEACRDTQKAAERTEQVVCLDGMGTAANADNSCRNSR
jgi:hypothetical protein